jgi:hypothetical protein
MVRTTMETVYSRPNTGLNEIDLSLGLLRLSDMARNLKTTCQKFILHVLYYAVLPVYMCT